MGYTAVLVYVHGLASVYGYLGRAKRGERVSLRFAKCTAARGTGTKAMKSLGGPGGEMEEQSESRIVVLPFYHPTKARTTTTVADGDFVSFHSRARSSAGWVYLK